MRSRSATINRSLDGRLRAMRRQRRRSSATTRPYCATNGCASFLEVDEVSGIAVCPICGYRRRIR